MEFKGTRLEKFSVFFSIYLLFSLSMVLFAAAEETKPFSGTVTIRGVNDPWNLEVILDKYSPDALTVMQIDVETCATNITCGNSTCETPYYEITDDEELPKDADGNEKHLVAICDYINSDGEHITLVLDPKRWTNVAVKYLPTTGLSFSDTRLEYYLMDQTKYSIVYTKMQGDVKVHTIQNVERLKKTLDDSTSTYAVLCSADLLGEAKIECNEQMMEIYALVATYWYFITHFWEFILASLKVYKSVCSILTWLKNIFGELFDLLGGNQNEYAQKLAQYYDKVSGLVSDAYELYEDYALYVEAALSCKDAYEYVMEFYDGIMELYGKFKKYLEWIENPFPICLSELRERIERLQDKLSGIQDKFNGIIDKLKDLYPECILSLDELWEQLKNIIPDCIKSLLDKLDAIKGMIERLKALLPAYCSKVQTMKQYYEDPAKGNNTEMAQKYGLLYEPCEDGKWNSLFDGYDKLPPTECVNLISGMTDLISELLPDECQGLPDIDFIALPDTSELFKNLMPDIELPDKCTDYKAMLEGMLSCGTDLDSYRDKYRNVTKEGEVSC